MHHAYLAFAWAAALLLRVRDTFLLWILRPLMWQPKLTRNLRACATLSTHTLLHRSNDRPLVSHQIGVVLQQNRYRCHELTGRKRLGHLKEVGAHREAFFYLRVTALGRQNKDLSPGCSKSVEKKSPQSSRAKNKKPGRSRVFFEVSRRPGSPGCQAAGLTYPCRPYLLQRRHALHAARLRHGLSFPSFRFRWQHQP